MTPATRRAVLASVPVAAALPSVGWSAPADDPGLAVLKEGLQRWRGLNAERRALGDLEEQLYERATADCWHQPYPATPPELAPYGGLNGYLDKTPPVEFSQVVRDYIDATIDWRHARNEAIQGHPAHVEALTVQERQEDLWRQMGALRDEMLAVRTFSPRGFMLKLAFGVYVGDFDAIEGGIRENYDAADDYLPELMADLQGMEVPS